MATYALTDKAVVLRPEDDVAVAKAELAAGTVLDDGGHPIEVRQDIRPGHKVARKAVRTGAPVRRYGQVIGFATQNIAVGDHVHTQNLGIGELQREYEVGVDVKPVDYYPPQAMRYFDGYRRDDGRVGTRNYVAIISGVNCSASVSQFVKDRFRDVQKEYPNVDGVLAITHKSGCGTKLFGEDHLALQRVLAGYAKHPNVAANILVGLGCETNQAAVMVERQRMAAPGHPERKPFVVNIQEAGGIRKTVERASEEVAKLLPLANAARRSRQPISELTPATNGGGSDPNSGRDANPALGWAVDELVRYGGTGVLAETPEIYGAEHLLIRRAINEGVAKKLIDRYKWWEWYCRGIEAMDNNPAPGNKAGGITTVFEKSLGGVTKGGTTPMMDVFNYGEPITTRGFVFMDTPGHDPVSITGLVAGGCNLICFTTGRGSVFGCKPVPSIKLATNSLMYRHMTDDMDIYCGLILYLGCNVLRTAHLVSTVTAVLKAMGFDFNAVGGPAYCCGIIHHMNGAREASRGYTAGSLRHFAAYRPQKVLMWCPSCNEHYDDVVKQEHDVTFPYEHVTAFIARHRDRVPFVTPIEGRVALHYHTGPPQQDLDWTSTRTILRAIPGLEYVEIDNPAALGRHCSSRYINALGRPAWQEHVARVAEAAAAAGVDVLATVYHSCQREICDLEGRSPFAVINYVTLLAEAMGLPAEEGWFKRQRLAGGPTATFGWIPPL